MSRFNEFYKRWRICQYCKKPIRLYDKYRRYGKSPDLIYEHRNCENPRSYEDQTPRERKIYQKEAKQHAK